MSDAITRFDLPGLTPVKSGKVRDIYDAGMYYLLVASDRISAFDCIMPNGIPGKGEILTRLSMWWFHQLAPIAPHHAISIDPADFPSTFQPHTSVLAGRSMLVKKSRVLPIECVARGYLIGSGWKEYQTSGTVCGIPLRPGYRLADRLDDVIFTPATKAETGHDENIPFEQAAAIIGHDLATRVRELTLALYREAARRAEQTGIILADTKFEFGLDADNHLLLIDEALTPDSSRYWPANAYTPGSSPPSYDKQFVRDYLESIPWNKQPPAPTLPPAVVAHTRARYLEAYRQLTGAALEPA
jgi:phosphoribosylaminoimidazole-succinocarboxamide synthase